MDCKGIKGKVALITGAAQGIGEAVARSLAELGAFVAVVDKHAEGVEHLVSELRANGYSAAAFPADVSDSAAVDDAVDRIERDLGPIEILVNVAGILRMGSIETLSNDDWALTFAVNTTGVFYVSRSVIKRMVPRKSGAVVTVGSNAAGVPRMNMSAYAASKAASTQFTKCLGLENAQHNIRCNVVSPGSTDTAMQRLLWSDEHGAEAVIAGSLDTYRVGIPLKKIAAPSAIADAVVFLVSDQAKHITMHDLCVDGGATLGV
ncbi:2,3-dihydro-2,3-dihydroxybenzoate dehydrogenase [Paenibacillus sp. SYP-B3998]|uniref:2,3-dihydro-2,3-dihydroxybenzoate dehydrogenase n=1 Tax=Paenibacillus sp. SYP-B3998 TaxID=2678564 RepID=A0A6G3ZWF6_9BACL|nr:2,3-dihydro-2,3-dihydroxybenzoate dehydrogenase [Paenibacillus sp. SYP-B3998]NEW06378.1 2,3-dihydro-2,3-dihydroxybenzoate dehydrogenase [Paenibacillus sp. SYP-B3998]